jgi:photosystem II stability/assembly factor-like uncharacterized protein
LLFVPATVTGQTAPTLTDLESGTNALLQAVSVVDNSIVWVSGHDGTVLRSLDGGTTWEPKTVRTSDPRDSVTVTVEAEGEETREYRRPMADRLEYRDVHAFDERRAVILSAGAGRLSRIYRTVDGGETWSLVWVNDEAAGFYDCLDFWDDGRGLLYGDSVDDELRVLLTADGGATWERIPAARLPPALSGEGGFAASGTCVDAGSDGRAWVGTGAGERARVLRTTDYGKTWTAADLPIVAGEAAGAFTIVFNNDRLGVVLGGDLALSDGFTDNVAITGDGGETWALATRTPLAGAVYGAALGTSGVLPVLMAVGPGGLVASADLTGPWRLLDPGAFWAVGAIDGTAWAVGPEGRVLKIVW